MQSLTCDKNHNNISTVLRTMIREEGVFRPIRGMNAMAAGAGPAHAMYFTALEKSRQYLMDTHAMPVHLASGKKFSKIRKSRKKHENFLGQNCL
jgi:hypothetical protein